MTDSEVDINEREHGLKPEKAREKLEDLGYTKDKWEDIIKGNLTSHEVRALITIAMGTEPRFLGKVYMEERVKDGLPADRLAGRRK